MSHFIKPASVDSYLSGICNQLEAHYPDVRQARRSLLVKKTLEGCKRLRAIPTIRKLPLSLAHLNMLVANLGTSRIHDDKLFLALILTGFHGLMRLGELTWPDNPKLRNWTKVSL
jgi:hypothetical protein